MASFMLSVKGLAEALSRLGRMERAGRNLKPVMERIGAAFETKVELGFKKETDPYGDKWKALSPLTRRRKRDKGGGHKILQDTRRLAGSISYLAGPRSVVIGTDVEYAPVHQLGSSRGMRSNIKTREVSGGIPRRMFLPDESNGLPESWQEAAVEEITDYLLAEGKVA